MVFASCRLWSDNIVHRAPVLYVCVCVCVCVCVWTEVVFPTGIYVHANLGCYGYPMGAWPVWVYICILGLVVSDKLEHQSTVKNKLTSPSSIIILRCSMTFGQGIIL